MTARIVFSSDRLFVLLSAALVIGITVSIGALAAAIWRSTDQSAAAERSRQAELQDFHTNLIQSMESLAEKSGMLTSSDLCPVRFRIRFPGAWSFPTYDIRADLTAPGDENFSAQGIARNGTLEFGLVPPGRYQVRLRAAESYALEHTFDVLPGVPVDRLVLCPPQAPPGLATAIEVEWPESSAMENSITVCDVEPDDVALGEWTWQPVERPPVRVIAGSGLGLLSDADLAWTLAQAQTDGVEVVSGAPYLCCRIRGMTVYRRATGASGAPVQIARCVYTGDNNGTLSDNSPGGQNLRAGGLVDAVICRGPAPTFEWSGGALDGTWRITAPTELVARIR
jgi:hypothetical protein